MASADQISCRNLGRRSWASAPTGRRASHINHPGQRRTAKRLRQRVRENGWESRQRSPQKGPATPDNPSVSLRLTAPFAQGSLRDGDADCHVGPVGLLAMTTVSCHSEERSDVGIRPFYDGRGFGPPYLGHGLRRPSFVPKFGALVRSSAPTESPINDRNQPARSEAPAPAWARDGRESVQRPSQKGDRRRDRPGSA